MTQPASAPWREAVVLAQPGATFQDEFVALFRAEFGRLFRYFDRATGDADLAADLVQEAFMRLYQRGALPDSPGAWLVTVGLNLLRNAASGRSRRARLLTASRAAALHADPAPSPAERAVQVTERDLVRATLGRLSDRDRDLLLLRASGYSYRELAVALHLNEASVGVLLARARQAFRVCHGGSNASD